MSTHTPGKAVRVRSLRRLGLSRFTGNTCKAEENGPAMQSDCGVVCYSCRPEPSESPVVVEVFVAVLCGNGNERCAVNALPDGRMRHGAQSDSPAAIVSALSST